MSKVGVGLRGFSALHEKPQNNDACCEDGDDANRDAGYCSAAEGGRGRERRRAEGGGACTG